MGSTVLDLNIAQTNINKTWIYKDINAENVSTDDENTLDTSAQDLDAIENGIYNMFLFRKGERIIEPEFGNSIYTYLYEPITQLTAKRIGQGIADMFERWEPRVNIVQIIVTPYTDQNTYHVEVQYNVPTLSEDVLNFSYAVNARR